MRNHRPRPAQPVPIPEFRQRKMSPIQELRTPLRTQHSESRLVPSHRFCPIVCHFLPTATAHARPRFSPTGPGEIPEFRQRKMSPNQELRTRPPTQHRKTAPVNSLSVSLFLSLSLSLSLSPPSRRYPTQKNKNTCSGSPPVGQCSSEISLTLLFSPTCAPSGLFVHRTMFDLTSLSLSLS